jgi:hypothetical protein
MPTIDTDINKPQTDILGHVLNLVQTDSEEWSPAGQEGMSNAIAKARESADEDEVDGMTGHDILSAAGIQGSDHEAAELLFYQEEDFEGEEWAPKGQPGLSADIMNAKKSDQENEMSNDGLRGHSVLSAVGITNDEDQDPDLFSFVQMETSEWTPTDSIGAEITKAHEDEDKDDTADLMGHNILSAVGITKDEDAAETFFLQQPSQKGAIEDFWTPKGQQLAKEDISKEEKKQPVKKIVRQHENDDLEGQDILSAVGLGHHLRQGDEADVIGKVKAEDFDLDLGLD